jgi:hypothetical protein
MQVAGYAACVARRDAVVSNRARMRPTSHLLDNMACFPVTSAILL